jgi:hypothetical protein
VRTSGDGSPRPVDAHVAPPSVVLKTPSSVPAYATAAFVGSTATLPRPVVRSSPELAADQAAPPSVLEYMPPCGPWIGATVG